LGSFADKATIAAANETSRFSSWFARDVAVFMPAMGQECFQRFKKGSFIHPAIGSFGQLAIYITQSTTANGQPTLRAFGEVQHEAASKNREEVRQQPARRRVDATSRKILRSHFNLGAVSDRTYRASY
jgi:hypothetical protein